MYKVFETKPIDLVMAEAALDFGSVVDSVRAELPEAKVVVATDWDKIAVVYISILAHGYEASFSVDTDAYNEFRKESVASGEGCTSPFRTGIAEASKSIQDKVEADVKAG